MTSNGDHGSHTWNGARREIGEYQAWVSAIVTALQAQAEMSASVHSHLARELELAKKALERALSR